MTPDEAQAILLEALAEPIGLLIRASDPKRASQRLYAARVKLGAQAADLQIRTWPRSAEADLAVVRRRVETRSNGSG